MSKHYSVESRGGVVGGAILCAADQNAAADPQSAEDHQCDVFFGIKSHYGLSSALVMSLFSN
jgi:hypothetical protein